MDLSQAMNEKVRQHGSMLPGNFLDPKDFGKTQTPRKEYMTV
jgi:hypothetical protein